MKVRVVTDSTSDLPPQIAQELGITVVPLYVHFGTEAYRDGVDLGVDAFYDKLTRGPILPTTSAPSPGVFVETFSRLAKDADGIFSLHISAKLSGTYESANLGKDRLETKCQVKVVDSVSASMGLGLLAMLAARAAAEGKSLDEISAMVEQAIPRARVFGMLDTLEYLHKGGRIGKAQALLGTMLNVKPIITVRDGEVHPVERVRTRARAVDKLCELAGACSPFTQVVVMESTLSKEGQAVADRLKSMFPQVTLHRARFGPVLGTYVGPGTVGIALLEQG